MLDEEGSFILVTCKYIFEPGTLPYHREERSLRVNLYSVPTKRLSVGDGMARQSTAN